MRYLNLDDAEEYLLPTMMSILQSMTARPMHSPLIPSSCLFSPPSTPSAIHSPRANRSEESSIFSEISEVSSFEQNLLWLFSVQAGLCQNSCKTDIILLAHDSFQLCHSRILRLSSADFSNKGTKAGGKNVASRHTTHDSRNAHASCVYTDVLP